MAQADARDDKVLAHLRRRHRITRGDVKGMQDAIVVGGRQPGIIFAEADPGNLATACGRQRAKLALHRVIQEDPSLKITQGEDVAIAAQGPGRDAGVVGQGNRARLGQIRKIEKFDALHRFRQPGGEARAWIEYPREEIRLRAAKRR